MLKILNAGGEEVMRINDDNSEEFADAKVKEEYEKAVKLQEQKDGK
jgi:hypothetical protein